MDGLDLLGADTPATAPKSDKVAKALGQFSKIATNLVVGGVGGAVLGGASGALLWKSHRVVGGLLGGLLVGPAVGEGVAYAVSVAQMKKLHEEGGDSGKKITMPMPPNPLTRAVVGLIGGDQVTTIPTAGADYTDPKTVAAVQLALVRLGYDCGTSGPNHDGIDGMFGPKTKTAIKKMQGDLGMAQTGKIDEGVISALKVTPGVLPPGVSLQDRAALQAQVALDAANQAADATTPAQVQQAAQAAVDASPPLPPEIRQQAMDALKKAKAAKTPADVKIAAAAVQKAAEDVHQQVKPSWWVEPTWAGGPPRWQTVAGGSAGAAGLGAILWAILG